MTELYYMEISAEDKQKAIAEFDFSKSMKTSGNYLVACYESNSVCRLFKGFRIWCSHPETIALKDRNLKAIPIKDNNDVPLEVKKLVEFLHPSITKALKKDLAYIMDELAGVYDEIDGNDPEIVGEFLAKLNGFIKEFREVE